MGLKSFAPLTIAAIGAIALVALFFIPFISILTLKYHLIKHVELNYEYNSADLVLLNLLNYQGIFPVYMQSGMLVGNKIFPTYRILSEWQVENFGKYISGIPVTPYCDGGGTVSLFQIYAVARDEAIDSVNKTVANLTMSSCYNLTMDSSPFVQSGNCETKNITCFKIFIPAVRLAKVCLKVGL